MTSASGPRRFTVGAASAGTRLDAFVATSLGVPAAAARRAIAAGHVRVRGRARPKGAPLVVGDVVEVAAGAGASADSGAALASIAPDATVAVSVIYEDDALVAIDKPAGIPSHPLRAGERGTAANAIVARFPECAGASPDPREGGLGHRLDTATSGVLIAARSRQAWRALRRALAGADCEKRYLAEVRGAPPDEGEISADIGRRGRRGRTVRVGGGRHPQAAATRWRVLARGGATAIVEARLHAGRAHQVRAHLAAAGFPIVGDDRYGAEAEGATTANAALRLHALAVALAHPSTGARLTIEAPLPNWAAAARASLARRGSRDIVRP